MYAQHVSIYIGKRARWDILAEPALREIAQPVELLLFSDRYANVPLRAVYVVLAEPAGCTSISLGQHVASSWAR